MPTNRFDEIRSIPLFAETSEESFSALVRGAYVQNFPPHTELITEGESADFLYIVSSGIVELFSSWSERESAMFILRPHATFILAATIKNRPYLMSARTLEKSRVIMIPSEDVREVFENDSDFAKSIVTELAGCYRETVRNLKNVKLRTSGERLANYIVKHSTRQSEEDALRLDIEKKKLASFLSMTPENLSRAFAALRNHSVEVSDDVIRVSDPTKLIKYAKPDPLIDN